MLPFNKRPRSEIEIQPDEIEAVQLPQVRPPSVRPAAGLSSRPLPLPPPSARPSVRPSAPPPSRASVPAPKPSRPPISFRPVAGDEEERTTFMSDKAPRRATLDLRQPTIPANRAPRMDSFGDEEATRLHPSNSSRSLISMNVGTAQRLVADDSSGHVPAVSASVIPEAPKSAAAVDMSMTTMASRPRGTGRPTAIWAAALVAIGVFTGLASTLISRGGSDALVASSAALIDPSLASGNIAGGAVKATQPVQVAPVQPIVAAAGVAAAPAAASCADSVTTTTTKVEPKAVAVVEPKIVAEPKVADVKPAAVVVPPPAHVAVAPKPYVAPMSKPVVTSAPAPKPVVASTPKPATGKSDMDSASAADALAKAQLEAALNR